MQGDGNLVVYGPGSGVRWHANTRSSTSRLAVQTDGNLVIYRDGGGAPWNSGTRGSGSGHRLVMQDDGNLVLYSTRGAVWSSQTGTIGAVPNVTLPSVLRLAFTPGTLLQSTQGTWDQRTTYTYDSAYLRSFDATMRSVGCYNIRLETASGVNYGALAYPWQGRVIVAEGLSAGYLEKVAVHECAHILQMWNTGGSWTEMSRRANEIYGPNGIEIMADCMSKELGYATSMYVDPALCTGTWRQAALTALGGQMP